MSDGQYKWGLNLDPPELGEHSKVKHELYRGYLRRFLFELIKPRGFGQYGIEIFDTFSGGGVYRQPGATDLYYGSPIFLLQVLLEMQQTLQANQRNPFHLNWRLHLVDASEGAHDVLRRTLWKLGFGDYINERVLLHTEKFEDALPKLIASVPHRRKAIFLLDQFGYRQVPFRLLDRIFDGLMKPEVILTFAFDQLARWMQDYDRLERQLQHLGVPGLTKEEFDAAISFQGGLEALIQRLLTSAFLVRAKYYTPFFVTSRKSHVAYWLVHLSMHARARDVMTALHWEQSNKFAHYGGAGHNMLGFDPYQPPPNSQGFMFDEGARSRTEWQLQEDLPRLLRGYRSSVPFKIFFADHANSSPADSEIIRQVLIRLAEQRQVEILTEDGGPKRVLTSLGPNDRLHFPEQPTFHFLRGRTPAHSLAVNATSRVRAPRTVQPSRARVSLGPFLLPRRKTKD